ncbi:MAG TPA: thiopeptide-type bacteriocin biosynthesis protein [Polyangia bacterium]|nr:thiopeptide-type bacteriocin biosynthesis protein [Polyangia bacterium]
MYTPLSRVLIRAPLLPLRDLPRAARALAAHPLGADAVVIASPALAAARPGAAGERARERYARRAAFRPTPSGLLAGVCLGSLGPRAVVATGTPAAVMSPSWARLDALARALLDEPAVRERVAIRVAPSLLRFPGGVRWIGPGAPFGQWRDAELDERLAAIVGAAAAWTPWPRVRKAAGDAEGGDDLLLAMVDEGLLQTDLTPPLVGAPAVEYLLARLEALELETERRALEAAAAALASGDRRAGTAALDDLPGHAERAVQAVLIHRPPQRPRIPRAAVARAARLVPLLIRLQQALAPPAAERLASEALADALDACTELHGAGAFDLEALATGQYGVEIDDDAGPASGGQAPVPGVVAFLAEALARAAREGRAEVALDPAALSRVLGEPTDEALPDSAELFLIPAAPRRGHRPGAGWLLGLHGPAGASLGRFAHALGTAGTEALAEIATAVGDGPERLDVAFAPSAELADLCAHPRIRGRALAISRWAAEGDLTLADLALVADPARPDALALRDRTGAGPAAVAPSPLWRVRSSTASGGAARLAVGWSLQRQHAPWAFTPGPLEAWDRLPRVSVDGFVIAPASWRVPDAVRDGRAGRAALKRWRREAGVPRHVQLGQGDELVPVDLEAPSAAGELAGVARVHEIWPPLDQTIDRDGRRIELVVPVVRASGRVEPEADLARVPPPREAPPLDGWRTFKLFGAVDLQDALLLEVVAPTVEAGLAAGDIDAWFFLRYEDGPGRRPHLRVRAHGAKRLAAFERRLRAALEDARGAGALTSLETGDYFPERGRFRVAELDGLHAVFQADSGAVLALIAGEDADDEPGPLVHRVRLFDAIAAGFGFGAEEREELARERRGAAGEDDAEAHQEADRVFRALGRRLRTALAEDQDENDEGALLAALRRRVREATQGLRVERRAPLVKALLHLSSVRLAGHDPDGERLGYVLWQRVREGLRRAPGPPR